MAIDGSRSSPGEGPFPEAVAAMAIRGIQEHRRKRKKLRLGADRAVDALFRNSYRTHTNLSAQADRKAGILISINGLIISISLASFTRVFDVNPWLLLPAGVLLIGCVTSMTYAVLTARPRITRNRATREQLRTGEANLFFFGNFVSLTEAEYQEGVDELMHDPERMYRNMTRDLYALGAVLERKFAMLWIAYTVLMVAVASSVVLYLGLFAASLLR